MDALLSSAARVFEAGILRENRPWVGAWTMREAVLVAISRLGQDAVLRALPGALGEAALMLAKELRRRWPELGDVNEAPWAGLAPQAATS